MKRTTPAILLLTLTVFLAAVVVLAPTACRASTVRNKTLVNVRITGARDRVYEGVVFKGGTRSGTTTAVLTISGKCRNLTFRNCTIATGRGNGVLIVDKGGTMRNVRFVGCRFASQPRIAFECLSRGSATRSFMGVQLVRCTFEPAGRQAVRLAGPSVTTGTVVEGCTIKGAGNAEAPVSGYAVQIDGPLGVAVEDTRVYATRWGAFDLQTSPGVPECGWSFKNVLVDFTKVVQRYGTVPDKSHLVRATNVNGSVWRGCTLTTGDAGNHVHDAGVWVACARNDLSTSTIAGMTTVGDQYWSFDDASVGNQLPRVRRTTISELSAASAKAGATLTVSGDQFGPTQGSSTVTFGELPNQLGFAPCAKQASVVSWSDTSITVTVPGMAPGSHPVYVSVGGVTSNTSPFTIDPVKVISNQTFTTASASGYIMPSAHDVVYENCTFTATNPNISGVFGGVLCLGQNSQKQYNVTFRNCTITSNTGAGSGTDYGVNGIKVTEGWGTSARDITFEGCTIQSMSRMGIEVINDGVVHDYRIALIDCTFQPCGAEAISFGSAGAAYSLVDGCTIQGYGNLANPQWPAAFEANRATFITVRDTQIWAGRGDAINIGGGGVGYSNLLFQNVDIDMSHLVQQYPTNYGARLFGCSHLNRSLWLGCTFNTGDAANHVFNAGYAENGDGWATCAFNDFSTCTIEGTITTRSYWDSGTNTSNDLPSLAP